MMKKRGGIKWSDEAKIRLSAKELRQPKKVRPLRLKAEIREIPHNVNAKVGH
jgi:hypothetical protein